MTEDARGDRELVDAVVAGDQTAFRALVEREAPAMISTCGRILGDPAEAADAAQDAFLQAYRAIATFRGDGPFGAWLRRIAIRVALARVAARRDVVWLGASVGDVPASLLTSGDEPEALTLESERRGDIRDAVDRLPTAQRDVILLRFYGDLTLQEIAEVTSQPVGTVKSRMHRGIAELRQQFALRSAR